ncbi:hypothetical protein CKAN_00846700 [Cinnamomum micranthum f. kanehirae]|uniref:Uncharacterized protein n=1 Tax=Cinnamomum micranthum f. kanehirae TaxID=337451 RepID=A0A3S3MAA2_9MAGN|nr:hypothetical protein CKAN_00846700 [Cinnamomum micranthum f. kanehirae]
MQMDYLKFLMKLFYLLGLTILSSLSMRMMPLTKQQENEWLKNIKLFWAACAAYCIDLMLEDMAKPELFPINASTVETARKTTKFIYNHSSVMKLMRREYTHGRDLTRTTITRFATNFISLQSLFKFRKELRQMFTSTTWVESNLSSTLVGMEIIDIILNNTFWRNVEHILKVNESLVVVLCLADSEDKPTMGYVYEAMDRAKEDSQLHNSPHTAAYYLNTAFLFIRTLSKHGKVIRGLNNIIEKLVPDFDTENMIFKQCDDYQDSQFDFGTAAPIQNRE